MSQDACKNVAGVKTIIIYGETLTSTVFKNTLSVKESHTAVRAVLIRSL